MDETIAAIATPLGMGSLSVVRMSGKMALPVADQVFRGHKGGKPSKYRTHTLHHGLVGEGRDVIEEVLLAVMRAPHSYTMEDVVEFSCHGGLVSAKRLLDLLLSKGVRLAHPGEFTRRAFLNGRIDLTQAEAVMDVISAQTEGAHTAAVAQLQGHLYRKIEQVYEHLTNVLSHVEAHVDFPDEGLTPDTRETVISHLRDAIEFEQQLSRTARDGHVLREGVRTVIVGKPNVGKSSLLNALLRHDRAIVSPIPGTTRDTIEEVLNIEGLPLRIVDTAGFRDAEDPVEREGVLRTRAQLLGAELVLLVLDSSKRLEKVDRDLLALCKEKPLIVVLNKRDQGQIIDSQYLRDMTTVSASMKNGEGLDRLRETISSHLWQGRSRESFREIFVNTRHHEALQRSSKALQQAMDALKAGKSLEYVAADLRQALHSLGEVNGRSVTEDVLDRIFSNFCVGK
ncbi:MAG: tRNA uridine-5-carboxymethylaminomethyl(34) synthesis GTPase MnmE [Verrucomicrobiae bacterium]|nr:tRNA uridine-5-carboxymethylaminomethyl(34) synthesis GTPase MnmE [Verrucomicrobiae bacterium]